MLTDDEHRHFAEIRHAFGVHVVETLEVHVAEADHVAELAQLHPIEDPAPYIARAFERVLATCHDRDSVLARLEFPLQVGVVSVAEQGASDGGRVQVGGVEVDEGLPDFLRCGLVDAFGFGAFERLIDVALGQVQAANRAIAGQLAPAGGLVIVLADGGGFLRRTGLFFHQPERHGNVVGCAHDNFIDHHDRNGGTSDRIDGDRLLVAGMADHDPLIDLDPLVLGCECVKFFNRNAHQQDRLMVLEHVGIDDHTLRVEQHLQVDGLAGIGRDIDHVDGLEGVALHLVALGKGADLVITFCRRGLGAWKELLDALLLGLVVLGLGERTEHQRQQQSKAEPPCASGASCEREKGLHERPA